MSEQGEPSKSSQFVARATLARVDWDTLVTASPDGWVFSLYGWQELILAVREWDLQDWSFGLHQGGQLIAVVPLQFNPHNRRIASSAWGGSGPVLHVSLQGKQRQRVMQQLLDECILRGQQCGATHFDFTTLPATRSSIDSRWGVNPFVGFGFDDQAGLSQLIDLSRAEDELWGDLSADTRRQIRIAKERGYSVERVDWTEHLDGYYALHCETYKRTGVEPHPRAYFSGMAAHTAPSGHSVLWCVKTTDGEVLAYHNAAWLGEGAYYHTGCSKTLAGEHGASYLLFWEAMLGAKAAGMRWYDCGAIFPNAKDPKQRGLTTFKTKFGGEPHRLFKSEIVLDGGGASSVAWAEEISAGLAHRLVSLCRKLGRIFD